jgi:hypothetical protein
MARAATAFGAADRRPGILDRSGLAAFPERGSTTDPPRGAPRTGPVLSRSAQGACQPPPPEGTSAGPDVGLYAIWFQLPLIDRQRFGHRFSGMVLKALGLRSCPAEEGET